MHFLREKFDVILVSAVFGTMFWAWVYAGFPPEMRDFVVGMFGAFLTVLGLRPRPNQNVTTDSVNADYVDNARTQSGDIISGGVGTKETQKDETSIDI